MDQKDRVEQLTKALNDEGKIIEAGWVSYQLLVIPSHASQVQITESRQAFFAGALHLFSSIMTVLESGEEATPADLRRMDKIHEELNKFSASLLAQIKQGK